LISIAIFDFHKYAADRICVCQGVQANDADFI